MPAALKKKKKSGCWKLEFSKEAEELVKATAATSPALLLTMEICSLVSGVHVPSSSLEYPLALYEPAEMPFFFHGSYRMMNHSAGMNQKNTHKGHRDSCIFLRFDTLLT